MSLRMLLVAAALASPATRAAAAEPAAGGSAAPGATPAEGASSAAATATAPATPTAPSAAAPAWRRAYQGTVGYGYYERFHAGAAFQPSPRSAIGLFAGTDFGAGDATTWDVGLSYGHALGTIRGDVEVGWDAKALYWQQSSPDYDWKMLSFVVGAYLAHDVNPRTTLALDAGVSVNSSLDVDRKQNVSFEYPTRWNGSLCLELRYRFDAW